MAKDVEKILVSVPKDFVVQVLDIVVTFIGLN
jgi:hypothetical protein